MINFSSADLNAVSIHGIGSKQENEGVLLSDRPNIIETDELKGSLLKYFFSSFREPAFHSFHFSSGDLSLNAIYKFATQIFENPTRFHEISIDIAEQLYEKSNHPNIKNGDLMMSYIRDVLVEDELVDAIAIIKSESKDTFLKLEKASKAIKLNLDKGVNIEKMDKACIILNTEKEDGYKLCIADKLNKKSEAQFWKSDFLNVINRSDDYHMTKDYIQATKGFVKERLKPLFEIDKTDEAAILNRSKNYFKNETEFNEDDYKKTVFQDDKAVALFDEYSKDLAEEKTVYLAPSFSVSDAAYKNQSSVFKSVLKLDKNFHVYIHGDRDLIQRGSDEDGRKFYKIYYETES